MQILQLICSSFLCLFSLRENRKAILAFVGDVKSKVEFDAEFLWQLLISCVCQLKGKMNPMYSEMYSGSSYSGSTVLKRVMLTRLVAWTDVPSVHHQKATITPRLIRAWIFSGAMQIGRICPDGVFPVKKKKKTAFLNVTEAYCIFFGGEIIQFFRGNYFLFVFSW